MPSSIRPITTTSGVSVVSAMNWNVARPNVKAIGTAAKTIAPTSPTKKISRLRFPSGRSTGASSASTPTIAMISAKAAATCRRSPTVASRSTATKIINPMPTGSAAARHVFTISSAGVVT